MLARLLDLKSVLPKVAQQAALWEAIMDAQSAGSLADELVVVMVDGWVVKKGVGMAALTVAMMAF